MLCPGCDEQRIDVELFPWKDIEEGMAYSFVCEGCGKEISVEMKSCNGSEGVFFITKWGRKLIAGVDLCICLDGVYQKIWKINALSEISDDAFFIFKIYNVNFVFKLLEFDILKWIWYNWLLIMF